jgi:molybdopterin-containing oxidoreductase family membrane subunit
MLFLLFVRYIPMVAMAEVKGVMPEANPHHGHGPEGPTAGGPVDHEAAKS